MTALNKTDSRLVALREVSEGKISYDPRTGTYSDENGTVSGARRRTFAELRSNGAIEVGGTSVHRVTLTTAGSDLVSAWS
ncbi:hypothetical protein [Actinophytocola sp.]|uniref:hypothetical protein n=1 Tax=Actinophytocola sp. TaxID=1872138 RepID=UPI002D803BC2|nr:hypothetical protein [Actinophytocola sp.]HET9144123.1 hypothetical protein [Actinophytocola sp.]